MALDVSVLNRMVEAYKILNRVQLGNISGTTVNTSYGIESITWGVPSGGVLTSSQVSFRTIPSGATPNGFKFYTTKSFNNFVVESYAPVNNYGSFYEIIKRLIDFNLPVEVGNALWRETSANDNDYHFVLYNLISENLEDMVGNSSVEQYTVPATLPELTEAKLYEYLGNSDWNDISNITTNVPTIVTFNSSSNSVKRLAIPKAMFFRSLGFIIGAYSSLILTDDELTDYTTIGMFVDNGFNPADYVYTSAGTFNVPRFQAKVEEV